MKWHVMGIGFSSNYCRLPLLSGSHCMPYLPSGHYGIWQGSQSCYPWRTALCYTVTSLPVIVRGWGVDRIDLRSRASSGSSGTQWGIGLYWPLGRCCPMPPSTVVLCVCVREFTWPPVRAVCPNYEVVVFQPLTVTPPHLGSVAIVTVKLPLPPHLFLPLVCIFILPLTSYCPPSPSL